MRNAILLAATLLASSMSLGAANPAVAPQRPTPDMKADYLRMEAPQGTFPLRAPSDEGPYDNPEGEKKAYVRSCT